MDIVFVHTPVPLRDVPGRAQYWRAFDRRYAAVHPRFREMRKCMWELPHWVPWLAGVLDAHGYRSIEVLELYRDCATLDGVDERGIGQRVAACPADLYLFSPMTANLPQALRVAEMIKEAHPRALVAFGGVVATPLWRSVLSHPCVDFVVRGRGEVALPALVDALVNGKDLWTVGNLSFKERGEIVSGRYQYRSLDPAEIAAPRISAFGPDAGQDIRYIRQNYALGCPFTCDFCTIQTIGASPSYFPVSRVIAEIRAYQEHYGQYHHVYFGDETFTLNTDRTLELCQALAREGDIIFDCQTRLNCLKNDRLPGALHDAGCRWLEIGLEAVSQRTQDLLKQHTSAASIGAILGRLSDAGVPACTYTMIGLPTETADDMKRTIDRVCQLVAQGMLAASYVSIFVPYPGTKMFSDPDRYGIRLHHHRYDEYHEDLPPVFESLGAPSEQVYEIFLDSVQMLAQAMQTTALEPEKTPPLRDTLHEPASTGAS